MSNLHPVFVRAKEILLTRGWYCGASRGPHGEPCIIVACCDAYEEICPGMDMFGDGSLIRIHKTLQGIADVNDVAAWNDNPGRTLEEVIAVLDEAILLTAPVVELVGSS